MSLGREGVLWLIPILLAGMGLGMRVRWKTIRRAEQYLTSHPGPELWPGVPEGPRLPGRWGTRGVILLFSGVFLGLSLAEPQAGTLQVPVPSPVAPLFIFLDVSPSMAVQDVPGSRLVGAKFAVRRVINELPKTPLALGVFAGEAHLILPPTADGNLLMSTLDAATPAMLTGGGTRLAAPLAVLAASGEGNRMGEGVGEAVAGFGVLILSDGEDHGSREDALSLVHEIRRMGGRVSTVVLGSRAGGPVPSPHATVSGLRLDLAGAEAGEDRPFSRADPALLSAVAEVGGGRSARWDSLEEMTALLTDLEAWGAREASGVEMEAVPRNVWPAFLALAVLGLFLESFLDFPAPRRKERPWR